MKLQDDKPLICSEVDLLLERAIRKLDRIIRLEGDADGRRLEPWYFAKILSEVICEHTSSQEMVIRQEVAKSG